MKSAEAFWTEFRQGTLSDNDDDDDDDDDGDDDDDDDVVMDLDCGAMGAASAAHWRPLG